MAFDNDIPLRPIRQAELAALLAPAFEDLSFHGGYDDRPFAPSGIVLLSLARRKSLAQSSL